MSLGFRTRSLSSLSNSYGAWVRLVSGFLLGQGLVQALTLLIGLALVRLLPVDQYALYTIAGALLVVVSVGSNFGLAQAIVSLGSARREDRKHIGALLNAARWWSRRLMVLAMACTLVLAFFMLRNQPWPLSTKVACVAVVLVVGWAQVGSSLGRAVLNIHHDARAIVCVGLAEAGTRLLLLLLCFAWPVALAALVANLAGALAASRRTLKRCAELSDATALGGPTERKALMSFVLPLAPIVGYMLAQGQIAILLLSAFAESRVIAETGALTRLGQVFSVLMVLNTFLVQPVFARVVSRGDLVIKLTLLIAALALLCVVTMASALLFPDWWLLIIGDKYSGLTRELPVAIATSLVTLVGASLYVVVIARGSTRWQSLAIIPCLGGQLTFIAMNGVRTTWDALMLGLIPAVAYALVQAVLLGIAVRRWFAAEPQAKG